MSQIKRLTALTLAVLLLSGCEEANLANENAALKAQNAALQRSLDGQLGVRKAEIDYLMQQASIAAGCDFMLPFCPTSIVAVGRKVQTEEEGIAGGANIWFWLAFWAKMFGAGSVLGGAFGSAHLYWKYLGRKAALATYAAQEKVGCSQEQQMADQVLIRATKTEVQMAKVELAGVRAALQSEQTELVEAQERKAEAEAAILATEAEIQIQQEYLLVIGGLNTGG